MCSDFEQMKTRLAQAALEDGESVLEMLYDSYSEQHPYDDRQTKADFAALYEVMNGMTLQEMDRVLDPLCALCRDHQRSGFIAGIRIGLKLAAELA